jgi:imidazolonepropionase-like amidohydrolase
MIKNLRKLIGKCMTAMAIAVLIGPFSGLVSAQDSEPAQILFKNVNVFDGTSDKLTMGVDVLVTGNLIGKVDKALSADEGATVIDGEGRTLMPGMIENHAHLMLMGPSLPAMESMVTWEDFAIHGTKMAEMYLNQGFTTVRDAGGGNGGLQRAIDSGMIAGPRYYPSAAFISGRGGHADFANYTAPIGQSSNMNRLNMAVEADGRDEVLKAARHNFRMGASQLKVMQSGGVVSAFDPWQMDGRTADEIGAAVDVAEQYGTYVMAHSYRRESMIGALEAGVKSLEHGFMYDCEIGKRITWTICASAPPGAASTPIVWDQWNPVISRFTTNSSSTVISLTTTPHWSP